jgi:hypothetical protein
MSHTRARILVIGWFLLSTAGCGSSEGRQAVSGRVRWQGQTIGQGVVTFIRDDPPAPMGGGMIQNGRFELSADQGLPPGSYKVVLSSAGGMAPQTPEEKAEGQSPRAVELLPPTYSDPQQTILKVEVKAGATNFFEFDLK